MKQHLKSVTKTSIFRVEDCQISSRIDTVATEEPLEIRLANWQKTIAITMRTPGKDFDLAAGFLYSEGIITQREDLTKISYCIDAQKDSEQQFNIVNVTLNEKLHPQLSSLERHFFTSSACGVCGKASIEFLKIRGCLVNGNQWSVTKKVIYSLSEQLRSAQGIFSTTGGLHAAALFDCQGNLLKVREDVGRHNALDKLIGSALLADELPLSDHIIMVSSRTSFEIVQKCFVAGVAMICAVSAPSSLAVSLAQEFNITLIGFLRENRFNVYSGIERIA